MADERRGESIDPRAREPEQSPGERDDAPMVISQRRARQGYGWASTPVLLVLLASTILAILALSIVVVVS